MGGGLSIQSNILLKTDFFDSLRRCKIYTASDCAILLQYKIIHCGLFPLYALGCDIVI